jgi:hypothetical protein
MHRASTIILISIIFWSCGKSSEKKKKRETRIPTEEERIKKIENGKKRPLRYFNEEDVARYAMAVFKEKTVDDFETAWTEDGVLITPRKNKGPDGQLKIKIGGDGVLLFKKKNNNWTDKFEDRRIFYFQEGKKLILSQTFEGDSVTYQEFEK